MAPVLKYDVDYSRFAGIDAPESKKDCLSECAYPSDAINKAYEAELFHNSTVDKIQDLKLQHAIDAYETNRRKDSVMHHYAIRDAGDSDAIGEYFPTGDERNSCPIYQNSHGITLTREKQPAQGSDAEQYGWILGHVEDRRPLYGVMTDDLSVPTVGWQSFTALTPVPTVRYFTHAAAAKAFKDKGNAAVQAKEYPAAESWYSKALLTNLDPREFPEPLAIVLSNRAQVRLALRKYSEANDDADAALRHLQNVKQATADIQLLKQKTFVRRVKALSAMKDFQEAETTLKNALAQFSDCSDLQRLDKEVALAKSSTQYAGGRSGHLLSYVGKIVEELQTSAEDLADSLADSLLPQPLTKSLLKLEYLLSKASADALSDVQTLLRVNGGLRTLLHLLDVQWTNHLQGRTANLDKLESLSFLVSIISMACDGSSESLSVAAPATPALFAALGSCNRKVQAELCMRLVSTVSQLWKSCPSSKHDIHSESIERSAAFISKLILNEPTDASSTVHSLDSPLLPKDSRDLAFDLLSGMLAMRGRIGKSAAKGAVSMLASFDGTGFMTAEDERYCCVGEKLLKQVIMEPEMLAATDVTNLLVAAQLLTLCDPGCGSSQISVMPSGNPGAASAMHFMDLQSFAATADGQHVSQMLTAVAKVLDLRLVKSSHELCREEYETAFLNGNGWSLCIPLAQGPSCFLDPALACMSAMPSMLPDSSITLGALLGFPAPEREPAISQVKASLASSSKSRACTAKFLSRCSDTDGFTEWLQRDSAQCLEMLTKLALAVSLDGKSSLEALHDMVHVFYKIAQVLPDAMSKHTPESLLVMFLSLSKSRVEDAPVFYAKAILNTLRLDRHCSKTIQRIQERFDSGDGVTPEDALKSN